MFASGVLVSQVSSICIVKYIVTYHYEGEGMLEQPDTSDAFLDTFVGSTPDKAFITKLWQAPTLALCAVSAEGVMVAANNVCVHHVGNPWRGRHINGIFTPQSSQSLPLWRQPFLTYKRSNILHLVGSHHVLHKNDENNVQQSDSLQDTKSNRYRRVRVIAAWQLQGLCGQSLVVMVFCLYEKLELALDSLEDALEIASKQSLEAITTFALASYRHTLARAL